MTNLQSRQFFRINDVPADAPNFSRKTQERSGIRSVAYVTDPVNQHGNVEDEGMHSAVLRRPIPSQPTLFGREPDAPHQQTPEAWLRRPDVMFHTGLPEDQPFRRDDGELHMGTAAAGLEVAAGRGKGTDVVARRVPDVEDLPTALDEGAQHWASMTAQYENRAEDKGHVSVITRGDRTRSWVEDQEGKGRFSDYANQLSNLAMHRQGAYPPDTSFRFSRGDTNRAHYRQERGHEMPPVDAYRQQRLRPSEWGPDDYPEWTHTWNKALRPRPLPQP